jgi:hypothetical protein
MEEELSFLLLTGLTRANSANLVSGRYLCVKTMIYCRNRVSLR